MKSSRSSFPLPPPPLPFVFGSCARTVIGFAVAAMATGCSADLVPLAIKDDLGPVGYCQTDPFNQFTVTVKNQGDKASPVSVVEIEFLPGGIRTKDLFGPGEGGSLPPGVAWDVQFQNAPPAVCFDPDCDFRITVDSTGKVEESNEKNNVVLGRCIG